MVCFEMTWSARVAEGNDVPRNVAHPDTLPSFSVFPAHVLCRPSTFRKAPVLALQSFAHLANLAPSNVA
jgi:hypothetical protein